MKEIFNFIIGIFKGTDYKAMSDIVISMNNAMKKDRADYQIKIAEMMESFNNQQKQHRKDEEEWFKKEEAYHTKVLALESTIANLEITLLRVEAKLDLYEKK